MLLTLVDRYTRELLRFGAMQSAETREQLFVLLRALMPWMGPLVVYE